MILITHNFDASKFMWLWAKYVTNFNERHHCTNSIRGRYSKKLWKGNPELGEQPTISLDEQPESGFEAVYICGVAKAGYSSHRNYPHNVHTAVVPAPGQSDDWRFENWTLHAENGLFLPIPTVPQQLPTRFQSLPPEYTTCRIFRWAACYFEPK